MKLFLPTVLIALQALGVAAILRSQWRRGVFNDFIARWRGMSLLMRALVVVLVSSGGAYAANKLLGNRLHEMLSAVPGAVASLCTNVFTSAEQQTGYAASAVRTNETHDLAMPADAQMAERIARRGAHNDGFYFFDAYTNRLAHDGLDLGKPVWVHTDGTLTVRSPAPGQPIQELAQTAAYSNITVYAPLQSSYGFLPASKWPDFMPSLIWTATTHRGSRVVTWEGARLDRDVAQPVSFQAEFHDNGEVTYRYNPAQTNYVGIGLFRNGAVLTFGLSDLLDIQDLAGLTTNHLPLTTLHLSYIGDLGDGSGDTDNDGLTDWEEVKRRHTDPREADTDGDGLMDGYEIVAETNPLDFDTDRDGLADAIDQEPLTSCGNAYGQSGPWIVASFTNAAEVIDMGYTNYIQSVLSSDNGTWSYSLSVNVLALGPAGRAMIRVGDYAVVVDELGIYQFILNVGPEYALSISSGAEATFEASDARAEITTPANGKDGIVAARADGISINPSWQHYLAAGESHSFCASIDGAAPSVDGQWEWSCEDSDVHIGSAASRTTDIVWNWQSGDYHDTWATVDVIVSCRLGEWAATNIVTLHSGSHRDPEMGFGINVPRAFFATNGAEVVVSFHSDIPTNGTISVADTSLATVLEEGPPWNWTLGDGTRNFCVTNRIRASAPSLMPEDIELTATFTLEGGQPTDVTATTTAVVLEEVVVPSAPDTGLVILAGSSVAMEAKCRPSGADLSGAETDWFLGRRRRDGSHDNWHKVATNESGVVYSCPFPTGGIYRLKADVTLAGERETTFFKIKSRDTLDPPKKYFYVGGYDHIGVVSEAWQRTLRNTAFSHLGSTAYAESAFLGSQHGFAYAMPNTPKCNFFVAHIAEDAGLSIPGMHGHNPLLPYPPLANDWATGSVIVSGWSHLSTEYPEPGWIVGHPNATGSGHCGIVDYDGFGIAAGRTEVNRKDPRFFDGSCGYNKTSGGNVE